MILQGKLIRQFWGKINRQSTRHFSKATGSQFVNGGGVDYHYDSLSDLVTFFHSVKRIE